jgi:transposase-like protein
MDPAGQIPPICKEMKNYIDGALRADLYLAVRWRWFRYYLAEYDEADVRACLQYLGVEVSGDVVFLWSGEYYRRLVEALAEAARRGGDVSVIAELYSEREL